MTVEQLLDNRYTSRAKPPKLTAGVTMKAVDALTDPNVQHFTRAQVAYLIHLAFLSGAEHRRAHDTAELLASWNVSMSIEETRAQRIGWELELAGRRAEIRRAHDAERPPPWAGTLAGCEWPEVAVPGEPRLQVAA